MGPKLRYPAVGTSRAVAGKLGTGCEGGTFILRQYATDEAGLTTLLQRIVYVFGPDARLEPTFGDRGKCGGLATRGVFCIHLLVRCRHVSHSGAIPRVSNSSHRGHRHRSIRESHYDDYRRCTFVLCGTSGD
jgi:hypothetical protein